MQRILLTLLLFTACCPLATAQDFGGGFGDFGGLDLGGGGDPVFFSAQFTAATNDRPAVLMVTAEIEEGYHVYSITQPKGGPKRTTISLEPSDNYRVIGQWAPFPAPDARIDNDIWKGLRLEEHGEKVTWYAPILIADGVNAGTLKIAGNINGQACKESCVPFKNEFSAELGDGVPIGEVVVDSTPTAKVGPATVTNSTATPPEAGVYRAAGSEITWYGWVSPVTDGRATLVIRAQPAGAWHVNAFAPVDPKRGVKPTLIGLEPTEDVSFGRPNESGRIIETDGSAIGFGIIRSHAGVATWSVPIQIDESRSDSIRVSGVIGYQACETNENGLGSCELAQGVAFAVSVDPKSASIATIEFDPARYSAAASLAELTTSAMGDDRGESALPSGPPTSATGDWEIIEFGSADGVVGTLSKSLLTQLLFAMLGGLILNLMPCVLPVIGLKVLSFAKQGGESKARVLGLNIAYVAGLMAVFLLLATLAALPQLGLGSSDYGWGELNTETWFKVSMTALIFAMALSFLGVWEIPIPGFAGSGKAASWAAREGISGAFAKGVLTTVLATPCSGPFLGPVLGYTISQPPHITYAIFIAIGLGMALPYMVIAMVPSLVQWIPKPGAWMETFKQLMAFLLLGTVVYLFSTINDNFHVATLSMLMGIWFACWWIGRTPLTASIATRWSAWVGGTIVAGFIGYASFIALVPGDEDLAWQPYSPNAVVDAQTRGQTVLVDFTADWCPTCKWNIEFVIDKPEIARIAASNDVLVLKADWTDEDEDIEAALAQLKSRSIPLLAIYPGSDAGKVIVLRDTISRKQLLRALALAGADSANVEAGWVQSISGGRLAQRPVAESSRTN